MLSQRMSASFTKGHEPRVNKIIKDIGCPLSSLEIFFLFQKKILSESNRHLMMLPR